MHLGCDINLNIIILLLIYRFKISYIPESAYKSSNEKNNKSLHDKLTLYFSKSYYFFLCFAPHWIYCAQENIKRYMIYTAYILDGKRNTKCFHWKRRKLRSRRDRVSNKRNSEALKI